MLGKRMEDGWYTPIEVAEALSIFFDKVQYAEGHQDDFTLIMESVPTNAFEYLDVDKDGLRNLKLNG